MAPRTSHVLPAFLALLVVLASSRGTPRDDRRSAEAPQASAATQTPSGPASGAAVRSGREVTPLAKLPMRFEENRGQVDPAVRFVARAPGSTLFLTDGEATLALHAPSAARRTGSPREAEPSVRESDAVVTMKVAGGRRVVPEADRLLGTRTNYFLGSEPSKWRTDVPNFGRITYRGVLDGVDLVFHGEGGQLEYDFVVAPGADYRTIALEVAGADGLSLTDTGDLAVTTPRGVLVQARPRVFQRDAAGHEQDVAASYRLAGNGTVAFEVASFDPSRELVIDPVLAYSTYLGGTSNDFAMGIGLDGAGNVYVGGYTYSTNFPSKGAYQPVHAADANNMDGYIAKLSPAGDALEFATYFGGNREDTTQHMTVDAAGNTYAVGLTNSTNFPTLGPIQATNRGDYEGFVVKLSAAGNALGYATYLGGTRADYLRGVAVDTAGNAYVAGKSDSVDFPTTAGAYQTARAGTDDVVVAKLNPAGSALVYSTYLGGTGGEQAYGLAIDGAGSAYVVGQVGSADFPVLNAFQPVKAISVDGFVTKLSPGGDALVYSTFLGGNGQGTDALEGVNGIAVDATGSAYVTGYTSSSSFPVLGAVQATRAGAADAFITRLSPSGSSLVFSTFLGGAGADQGYGVAVDGAGNAVVVGTTTSANFLTRYPLQGTRRGTVDIFVTKVSDAGTLLYSTYLGGMTSSTVEIARTVAFDPAGSAYVAGHATTSDFPTTAGVYQPTWRGAHEVFVLKLATPPLTLEPSTANVAPAGTQVFTGRYGSEAGFVYSLATNASGGSIDPATGLYTAGPVGNVADVVMVTDSAGATATATVNVTLVKILPATVTVPPRGTQTFAGSGGSGAGFVFSLSTNASTGTIDAATGAYTAGATGNVTDVVKVMDSTGAFATASVSVGPPVSLSPLAPSTPAGGALAFSATGGQGSGYEFSMGASASGGTIDRTTGAYRAGATTGIDTVKVTDPLGNTASTNVTVTAPIPDAGAPDASPDAASPPLPADSGPDSAAPGVDSGSVADSGGAGEAPTAQASGCSCDTTRAPLPTSTAGLLLFAAGAMLARRRAGRRG